MKKVIYITFLLLFTLIILEFLLRLLGFKPSIYKDYDQFKIVDKLFEYKNYTTDESGIYKFSSWISDSTLKYLPKDLSNIDHSSFTSSIQSKPMQDSIEWGMDHLIEIFTDYNILYSNFEKKQLGNVAASPFKNMLKGLFTDSSELAYDSLIYQYIQQPFNKEGFRSIPFNQVESKKMKVLLIGDSFIYGQSTKPFYNSSADILLSKGYLVYNLGITGTDLAQYEAIAQKYIPIIKPDLVIINFYEGNDIMLKDRLAKTGQPHEYLSNAGFFYSNPEGNFLSLDDAYNYYKSMISVPKTNIFNQILEKSALGTQCWSLAFKNSWVCHPIVESYNKANNVDNQTKILSTKKHVDHIASICKGFETPYIFSVIPEVNNQKNVTFLTISNPLIENIFADQSYFFPKNLSPNDYNLENDFHFNNQGAKKYAEFLDDLIKMKLAALSV